jgi:hypothetical protein
MPVPETIGRRHWLWACGASIRLALGGLLSPKHSQLRPGMRGLSLSALLPARQCLSFPLLLLLASHLLASTPSPTSPSLDDPSTSPWSLSPLERLITPSPRLVTTPVHGLALRFPSRSTTLPASVQLCSRTVLDIHSTYSSTTLIHLTILRCLPQDYDLGGI